MGDAKGRHIASPSGTGPLSQSPPALHLRERRCRTIVRTRIRRWGVFNAVGLAVFLVQLGAISVPTRPSGWHYPPATVAMQIVIAQHCLAHSRWTWVDRPARTAGERLVRPLRYQRARPTAPDPSPVPR